MKWKEWNELPEELQVTEVREYYDILSKKRRSLRLKRCFDILAALIILVGLSPIMLIIAVLIIVDSPGGVFYCQERVTQYGKIFHIHKFRTMIANADKFGSLVTVQNDNRVTKMGKYLRKYRLDELPQVFDVLAGNMSFVGTRPEATKYTKHYTNEMKATLLLPAGITSKASIHYKDEAILLDGAEDADKVYVEQVLPEKMKYNLESLKHFSFADDITTMLKTVLAVLR